MQWTAPTNGIAMCHIAVALEQQRESACGYKENSSDPKLTSAITSASDILGKAGKV